MRKLATILKELLRLNGIRLYQSPKIDLSYQLDCRKGDKKYNSVSVSVYS